MIKKIAAAIACVVMIAPTAANSQSIGDLLVSSIKSKGMKKVCSQQGLLDYFTAVAYGYYPTSFQNNAAVDALALELAAASSAQWTFLGWSGYSTEGSCRMKVAIVLPPQYVAQFDGNTQMQGEAFVNLVQKDDGSWKVSSISDAPGSGVNQFRQFALPHVNSILESRRQQVRDAELQEDNRRQAEAEASRQEWIRTHPKEYAAAQAAERQKEARYRALVASKQLSDARRQEACEANGGTWGHRDNGYGMPIGAVGCFFQTVGN